MKCPNCRCIVPNNFPICAYCGYEFESGEAKTLSVAEAYKDRITNYDYLYSDNQVSSFSSYNYYDYGNWLISYSEQDHTSSKKKKEKRRKKHGNFIDTIIDNDFMYLLVLVVMLIVAIILSIVLLFI